MMSSTIKSDCCENDELNKYWQFNEYCYLTIAYSFLTYIKMY